MKLDGCERLCHLFAVADVGSHEDTRCVVRSVAGRLVRAALLQAGLKEPLDLPANGELAIDHDAFGRPEPILPASIVSWLSDSGLGLSLSISHTQEKILVITVVSP